MQRDVRHCIRFAIFLLTLITLPSMLLAASALPAQIQSQIDAAAAEARSLARQESILARNLNVGDLAAADSRLTHRRTEAVLSGVVIAVIAARPALAPDVIAAAVAAAPEFRDSVVKNATRAFPGFAGVIQAGLGTALPSAASSFVPARRRAPLQQAQLDLPRPPPADTRSSVNTTASEIYDPWEGFNRSVFAFNDVFDRILFKPLAQVYGFLMPDFFKDNIRNAFSNFNAPVVLANDLLQFEGGNAMVTSSRFIVNSTVGLLGLFEIADGWGLEPHPADFGQTLYSYGSGPGPYLILPFLGPSTVRDGTGTLVDIFLHPRTYLLGTYPNVGLTGGSALVRRENLIVPLDDLRENSIDFYAALRSAYFQDRAADLSGGKTPDNMNLDQMFDQAE
jgi:phospholipid-binding lipoprotein MlaA